VTLDNMFNVVLCFLIIFTIVCSLIVRHSSTNNYRSFDRHLETQQS